MIRQVFFLALFIWGIFGQSLSTYFGDHDAQLLTQFLTNSQKKDGTFLGLKNTFYAVSSFHQLKATVPQKEKVCEFLSSANVVDTETLYYVVASSNFLGCSKTSTEQHKTTLKNGLKSDSLNNIYFGSLALSVLAEKGKYDDEISSAFKAVSQLVEEDGTARANSKDDETSLYNGALALNALSNLASHLTLTNAQKQKLGEILSNAFNVEGSEGDNTLEFKEPNVDSVKLTSLFFQGLNNLHPFVDKKTDFKKSDIALIAEFFIQNKNPSTLEDAHFVLSGIHSVGNSNFGKPLVLNLVKNFLSTSSKSDSYVKVLVTDVNGKFASKAKVILSEAVAVATKKQVVVNQEIFLAEKETFLYQTNFLATKPEPGSYRLVFRVIPEDKSFISVESSVKSLKIVGSASLSDVQIVVSDSSDVHSTEGTSSYAVNYPTTSKESILATSDNHLFFNFKVTSGNKNINVHQAFVRLANHKTQAYVNAVAEKKGNKYQAHISIADAASEVRAQNGTYDVELFVGDAYIDNSLSFKAASVDIKFSSKYSVPEAEVAWKPKKEIQWTQRPAEPRPAQTISFAFTLLIGAPFFFLLVGLLARGANIGKFPFSGTEFLYAVGFQGGIGLILALYGLYWLRLNMVQTLQYLGIISIPTLFFGVKTLNYLSSTSQTPDSKKTN